MVAGRRSVKFDDADMDVFVQSTVPATNDLSQRRLDLASSATADMNARVPNGGAEGTGGDGGSPKQATRRVAAWVLSDGELGGEEVYLVQPPGPTAFSTIAAVSAAQHVAHVVVDMLVSGRLKGAQSCFTSGWKIVVFRDVMRECATRVRKYA